MKKVKIIIESIITLMIVFVAVFNVSFNLQKNKHSSLSLASIETALANSENTGGGGGWTWNCSTLTSNTYEQSGYCYEYERYVIVSKWVTRECNNGVLTWCYPGYIVTYYNCDGSVDREIDNTYMSGCL